MRKQSVILASLFAVVFQMSAVWAGVGHRDHGAGIASAGQSGSAAKVSRTIKVSALDTMRYDKANIYAKPGETIRFIVTNAGKIKHEFAIGTREVQLEHAKMMSDMPDMKHDEGNVVSLEPGETGELIWQFGKAGSVEIACHLPGHYEAGMKSRVSIRK